MRTGSKTGGWSSLSKPFDRAVSTYTADSDVQLTPAFSEASAIRIFSAIDQRRLLRFESSLSAVAAFVICLDPLIIPRATVFPDDLSEARFIR